MAYDDDDVVDLECLNAEVSDQDCGRLLHFISSECGPLGKKMFNWWCLNGGPALRPLPSPQQLYRDKQFLRPFFNRYWKHEGHLTLYTQEEWDRAVFDQVVILTGRTSSELTRLVKAWEETPKILI